MKKNFKKVLAVILAIVIVAGAFAACTNTQNGGTNQKYTIGIVQLVEHVALDAATEGFKQAIIDELGEDAVEFKFQNAQNDIPTCSTIANQFVSEGVDLIMANATPALQATAAATADIPILGTSVTEYGVALEIDNFNGTVGGNISGTSDLAPLDQQAKMITEWFPQAKNIGLVYCSGEANSQYQVNVVLDELKKAGVNATLYPFTDSNDLQAICQNAADASDVIYVPTDNTVASNKGIIDNICSAKDIPVFTGEEGACIGCGVATLSISYYDLGYKTGQMAVKILRDGADISTMAIEYAPTTPKYNPDKCTELGITPLEGYEAIEVAE